VRLEPTNIGTVAAGADLLVDCLDNIAGRQVVLGYARESGTASVHAGVSADGGVGLIRWRDRFTPDPEPAPGQATCQNGEHLAFLGLVGATLATVIADHVRTGTCRDVLLTAGTPGGV
jgi:hypothetical protein